MSSHSDWLMPDLYVHRLSMRNCPEKVLTKSRICPDVDEP